MTDHVDAALRTVGGHLGLPAGELHGSVLDETVGLRSVVRIDWPGGPGAVAKLYADESGEATFHIQAALAAQVPADSPHLAIPEPLTYDASSRILVQRMAVGDGLGTRVRSGDMVAMEQAGRATGALHALDLPDHPPTSIDDHMTALMRPHPDELAAARPELAPRIGALTSGLRSAAPPPGAFRAPIHRDLHPRQMIVDGDRVAIVDWDLAGVGDPALDLGNIQGWLATHLPGDAARGAAERFLTGYVHVAGDAALARLDTYRAFTYLRLACKRHRLGADAARAIVPLLDAAEAALDADVTS